MSPGAVGSVGAIKVSQPKKVLLGIGVAIALLLAFRIIFLIGRPSPCRLQWEREYRSLTSNPEKFRGITEPSSESENGNDQQWREFLLEVAQLPVADPVNHRILSELAIARVVPPANLVPVLAQHLTSSDLVVRKVAIINLDRCQVLDGKVLKAIVDCVKPRDYHCELPDMAIRLLIDKGACDSNITEIISGALLDYDPRSIQAALRYLKKCACDQTKLRSRVEHARDNSRNPIERAVFEAWLAER